MQQPEEDRELEDGMRDRIEFVVGSELKLKDVLIRTDLDVLFDVCLKNGALGAAVTDDEAGVIHSRGTLPTDTSSPGFLSRALFFEGESVGSLCMHFPETADQRGAAAMLDIAHACLDVIIRTTAKRMLATELHTQVVHQSYDELLEANTRLQASEKMYRELSESLEQKVVERTEELKTAHTRMLQQEKMASIGQLAAGMAHEINNPIGFIASNLNTFEGYVRRMQEMIRHYRSHLKDDQEAEALFNRLKIGFILEDTPELIRQSRDGAERVRRIVADLKGFSHIDDAQEAYISINEELDRTIQVLEHESRGRATFIRHYGELTGYFCRPGLICQVFLNIIQNALQASDLPVQIRITTAMEQDQIVVSIEDDGPGIPEEIAGRIFEPFFTTKDVGKGTGLGLSVAYDIVKNHGGSIVVSSVPGEGAAFTIRLPMRGRSDV